MEEKLKAIRAWIEQADQKIVVAQKLLDLGYYDDATSRAYYGMFYAAKAALLSVDVDTKTHAGVLNQFSQQDWTNRQKIWPDAGCSDAGPRNE